MKRCAERSAPPPRDRGPPGRGGRAILGQSFCGGRPLSHRVTPRCATGPVIAANPLGGTASTCSRGPSPVSPAVTDRASSATELLRRTPAPCHRQLVAQPPPTDIYSHWQLSEALRAAGGYAATSDPSQAHWWHLHRHCQCQWQSRCHVHWQCCQCMPDESLLQRLSEFNNLKKFLRVRLSEPEAPAGGNFG